MAASTRGTLGLICVSVVGVLLLGVGLTGWVIRNDSQTPPSGSSQPSPAVQKSLPVPSATSSSSASSLKSRTLITVPTSHLEKLWIPATDQLLSVQGMKFGKVIDPPFDVATIDRLVYYDDSGHLGGNPGSHAKRATYIACHTWHTVGGHSACNVIDKRLKVGDDVYALTSASRRLGVWLHYKVTARPIYGSLLSRRAHMMWLNTSRLMFVTCHLVGHQPQQGRRVIYTAPVGVVKAKQLNK